MKRRGKTKKIEDNWFKTEPIIYKGKKLNAT